MKKILILLIVLALLAGGLWFFREPLLDLLPISQKGWTEQEGIRCYLDENGQPLTGWQQLDGKTYFFSETGALHTGWLEDSGSSFYLDHNGTPVTGWQTIQGKKHCFAADGKAMRGFLEENGKRFYLDETGSPDIGFFTDGEVTYFLLDSGNILTGWLTFAEGTYYLNEDGSMHTGWLEEAGKRYYFGEADGSMSTGWVDTPEGKYFLNSDGTFTSGLVEVDGVLRGFGPDGAPLSGWAELNGLRYYFNQDGTLYQGWLEEDGKRYYIKEDGTPAVGKLVIDDQAFFFSSTGMNFIFVNPWNPLPEGFTPELTEIGYGHQIDPACQEALEQMLADCRAAGFHPTIVSSYRSIDRQKANLQRMINSYLDDGYSYNDAYARSIQIVAVPGTSEHHLGLALDIVDSSYTKLNHQQAKMPTQKWLMEHCWEYGFILRYPENTTDITGIIWEPWHYRYVGTELSLEIRDLGGITLEEYIDNLTNDGTTCGGKTPE